MQGYRLNSPEPWLSHPHTVEDELTVLNAPFLLWLFYDSEAWHGAPWNSSAKVWPQLGVILAPQNLRLSMFQTGLSKASQHHKPSKDFTEREKNNLVHPFIIINITCLQIKTILLVSSALWSSKNGKNWMMIPQFGEMVKKWKTSNSGIPNTPLKKHGRAIDIDMKSCIRYTIKNSKWIFKAASQ